LAMGDSLEVATHSNLDVRLKDEGLDTAH
jgi:hypothetical protein